MKRCNKIYLLLSAAEGVLFGGYFCLAKRDREPISLISGCMRLACSVFHGMLGLRKPDIILMEDTEDD